jgi:hypothetical protein
VATTWCPSRRKGRTTRSARAERGWIAWLTRRNVVAFNRRHGLSYPISYQSRSPTLLPETVIMTDTTGGAGRSMAPPPNLYPIATHSSPRRDEAARHPCSARIRSNRMPFRWSDRRSPARLSWTLVAGVSR